MLQKYIGVTLTAAIINTILFFIFEALGIITDIPTPSGSPVSFVIVILSTLVGGVFAYLLYLLITRVCNVKSPLWFRVIGYILLVLTFLNPLAIEGVTIGMMIALNIMHVVLVVPLIEASARTLYMAEPVHE